MENRSRSLAACLSFIALFITSAISAQEMDALSKEGEKAEIERGLAMQARARHIRQEAEAELASEREACEKKFFVYDCRSEAYERYLEKLEQSREIAREGRNVEVEQRKKNLGALRTEQASEAAARAEKDAEREKTVAEERKAREASYKERQDKHAARTEKKTRKAAARRENAEKRQEENAEKRTRREEERAAKGSRRSAPTAHSESEETQR